jgi:K+-transporting ATPase KdpF subunit
MRSAEWRRIVSIDHIVGLIVTVGLLIYLTYALLKPEKF